MFEALAHWLKQIFGSSQPDQPRVASLPQAKSNSQTAEQFDSIDAASHLVPYDENMLERARTQWQFGDWHSLVKLDRDTLQHHPDRAKLILLAAAGRLQIGQDSEARQYIRLAQDWGCSKKQISQVLISGVHNSIGMAAAIGAQQQRSAMHFKKAIQIGSPSSDTTLLSQARKNFQTNNILFGNNYGIGTINHIPSPRDGSEISESNNLSIYKKNEDLDNYPGIFEWKPEGGGHNFGDHLGILMANKVYSMQSLRRIRSGNIYIHAFVGSLLSNSNLKKMHDLSLKPVLIGCGYRGEKIDKLRINNCLILGCRGPLSRQALKEAGLDIPIIGDTAILLPLLLPSNTASQIKNKVTILIPHILDKNRLNYNLETINCDKIVQAVTYSLNDLENLVYTIAGAKFVFAGAMHAAIVAYAYKVPFAFFDSKQIDCPPKWNDFAMSVGLSIQDVIFHSEIIDGIEWYEKIKIKLIKPDQSRILKEFAKIGDINPEIIQHIRQHEYE